MEFISLYRIILSMAIVNVAVKGGFDLSLRHKSNTCKLLFNIYATLGFKQSTSGGYYDLPE